MIDGRIDRRQRFGNSVKVAWVKPLADKISCVSDGVQVVATSRCLWTENTAKREEACHVTSSTPPCTSHSRSDLFGFACQYQNDIRTIELTQVTNRTANSFAVSFFAGRVQHFNENTNHYADNRLGFQNTQKKTAELPFNSISSHLCLRQTHQAAVVVRDLANLLNALLKHAIRGRVGHHESCQLVLVLDGLQKIERQNSDNDRTSNPTTHRRHGS